MRSADLGGAGGSVFPIGNTRFAQIVGRHLHLNLVADTDADEVFAHLAGDVSQHFVSVRERHAEHGPREHLCDRASQFNGFFFRHAICGIFSRYPIVESMLFSIITFFRLSGRPLRFADG